MSRLNTDVLLPVSRIAQKKKKKSTSEERLVLAEFHTELSGTWASGLKVLRLCRWAALSSEGSTGTWALCACNQTSLGTTSAICPGALKHDSAKLTWTRQGGTWAASTAFPVDDLPLGNVLIHKSAFWNETVMLFKTRFLLVTTC